LHAGTAEPFRVHGRRPWVHGRTECRAPVLIEAPSLNQPDSQNIKELWDDFLAAIESGSRPVCDIEEIHRSTVTSLLGMLSLKLGRSIQWDGARETIPGDPEAAALLAREYRKPWEYPAT
jgi:hypothetical protein